MTSQSKWNCSFSAFSMPLASNRLYCIRIDRNNNRYSESWEPLQLRIYIAIQQLVGIRHTYIFSCCDTWYVCFAFAFSFHNLYALKSKSVHIQNIYSYKRRVHIDRRINKFSQFDFVINSNGFIYTHSIANAMGTCINVINNSNHIPKCK